MRRGLYHRALLQTTRHQKPHSYTSQKNPVNHKTPGNISTRQRNLTTPYIDPLFDAFHREAGTTLESRIRGCLDSLRVLLKAVAEKQRRCQTSFQYPFFKHALQHNHTHLLVNFIHKILKIAVLLPKLETNQTRRIYLETCDIPRYHFHTEKNLLGIIK